MFCRKTNFVVYLLMTYAVLNSGCMVMSASVESDDLLVRERVEQIRKGATSRAELIKLLGPPSVALSPGGKATIQSTSGTEELTYELAFLPFSDKVKPSPEYSIFYYQNSSAKNFGVVVVAVGTNKTTIERDRLWVLLDEKTGIVTDYVFRND